MTRLNELAGEQTSCVFIPKVFIHIFDGFWLLFILLIQGTIINYYIIMRYKDSVYPYFFFVLDFFSVCIFVGTLCIAYCHLKKALYEDSTDGLRRKVKKLIPSWMGESPLSYFSWLFYVLVIVIKIFIIFNDDNYIRSLSVKNHFGPQLLQVTLASSGFIFLLLIEGHNWKKRGTARYSYITSICAKTGIEIFDSVSMLAILMEGPDDLSDSLRDSILILAAINFVLPSIKLYQLSFPDFSKRDLSLPITVLYMVLHMAFIDFPFLIVRLYLWLVYRENASMFLMKNLLSIVLTLRGMYPELVEFKNDYLKKKKKRSRSGVVAPEKFEEVALNDKSFKPEDV